MGSNSKSLKDEPGFAHRKAYREFSDLTTKQKDFIDQIVNHGKNYREAYELAGYSTDGKTWRANARDLFTLLRQVINKELYGRLEKGVPLAIHTLEDVMVHGSDSLRLKAALAIMDRTGFNEKQELTVVQKSPEEMTPSELNKELEEALGELNGTALRLVAGSDINRDDPPGTESPDIRTSPAKTPES